MALSVLLVFHIIETLLYVLVNKVILKKINQESLNVKNVLTSVKVV
jgi:hypothetical protein